MSRALWFVAGAGAGVYAAVRARRAAEILTVDGLRDRIGAAAVGARMLRDEVAQGKADAEPVIRAQLGRALAETAPTDQQAELDQQRGSVAPEATRSRRSAPRGSVAPEATRSRRSEQGGE